MIYFWDYSKRLKRSEFESYVRILYFYFNPTFNEEINIDFRKLFVETIGRFRFTELLDHFKRILIKNNEFENEIWYTEVNKNHYKFVTFYIHLKKISSGEKLLIANASILSIFQDLSNALRQGHHLSL